MRSLAARAAFSTTLVSLVACAVLCASAGTLGYWQAWTFAGLMWLIMTATNAYLLRVAPGLLERRLVSNRETRGAQRGIKVGMYATVLAMLALAGLDRRWGWSHVPAPLVTGAFVAIAAGALVIFLVLRENRHASYVVAVEADQTVVGTGPYRWVRHPMYLGALLQGFSLPLALGSYWAEVFSALGCAVVVVRLIDEERLLRRALSGYAEYARRTRHRLVPGIW
jgi:protein-S-isoprenylcysteine O-methyltransferase Ste14